MPTRTRALIVTGLLALAPGCAEKRGGPPPSADPMRPEPPLWQRTSSGRPSVQPVDTSGPIIMNEAQPPQRRGLETETQPERISPTVREAVRPVDEEAMRRMAGGAPATAPAPAPTTRRDPADAPQTTGGYQLVGTVLAEVHDQPIFADKVLAGINSALAAQAAQLEEQPFRRAAAELIAKEVQRRINDELEFAMARDRLDSRDRELARMAAIRWRDEQITKAGGSLEVARQRAAAAGYDFDELQEEQFRWLLRQLYYQKREYPKIQVSASDIRRYYQEHQREFTTPDRARFRVIKVKKDRPGGPEAALGEINRLLDRVRSGGKDFAEVAAQDNDQESFKQPVDWFQRGSFVVKEVEDAVWKLEPGQITDVIETPDAYYIARLDAKQPGGTKSFNDPDVQAQIVATIRQQQFSALQRKVQEQLRSDAIIRYHPRMMDIAVEMAMQKYRYWREQASAK
jgi:parvulin-like peptidyl-prolyl isomerase